MKYTTNSVHGFADAGVPHGDGGWSQDATTMSRGVRIKFQMTNFIVPLNKSFMKYALKSVPGLADVWFLHGDGDGPTTPPRCLEEVRKKFQITNFTMPNN